MIFEWMDANKAEYRNREVARVLVVSLPGYYYWVACRDAREGRAQEQLRLLQIMSTIHFECRKTYGYRRMKKALAHHGPDFDGLDLILANR